MLLIINAFNIKNGGGKNLLEYFISNTSFEKIILIGNKVNQDLKVHNNVIKFLKAKNYLHAFFICLKLVSKDEIKVLNFGNLPFPKVIKHQYTLFHRIQLTYLNRAKSHKKMLSFFVQRSLIKILSKETIWIVQSKIVKLNFIASFGECEIFIMPFFSKELPVNIKWSFSESMDIVYFSNAASHKNHNKLFQAWEISRVPKKARLIVSLTELEYKRLTANLNSTDGIVNVGWLKKEKMMLILSNCRATIYPSLYESFGLGLVEAANLGCPIYASNLPFVHEIINPSGVFNPKNIYSIKTSIENIYKNEDKLKKSRLIVNDNLKQIEKLIYASNHTKS